jgi:hypothetical protein
MPPTGDLRVTEGTFSFGDRVTILTARKFSAALSQGAGKAVDLSEKLFGKKRLGGANRDQVDDLRGLLIALLPRCSSPDEIGLGEELIRRLRVTFPVDSSGGAEA